MGVNVKFLRSMSMAFTMYSWLPVPRVRWEKENMAYAMCFFPLVGALVGAILFFWLWLCAKLNIGFVLRAAGAVLIPIAVSGAIHMDGFCDTADALGSRQTRERKLEILKDSSAGAFAVISCAAYLLIYFALWCQIEPDPRAGLIFALMPVLSRSLSGLSVVTFKSERGDGLQASFSKAAQTKTVRIVMILWCLAVLITAVVLMPLPGAFACAGALIAFIYYRIMSYRQFGGTTGDVAGYFLQISELMSLLFMLIALQWI